MDTLLCYSRVIHVAGLSGFESQRVPARFESSNKFNDLEDFWLGRQDSNLGMAASKAAALPLGDAPTWNVT
jgi:hypothetical protein